MEESQPLVSVVTPVYNTGEFLEQAILSVRRQSYRNFEYVICDNHSTDASRAIAERHAAEDPRIRVLSPPTFLPQAQNFNYALQQISASSRYVKMVLADDWLFPNCLSEFVACAEQHPTAALFSSYRLLETQGDCFGLPVEDTCIPGRVAGRYHLLKEIFLFGTPSTVFYTADIVRSRAPRFYPEDRFFHDTEAVFRILQEHDFGFVHQVLSFSRYQPGSITHEVSNFYSRQLDRVLILQQYGKIYLTGEEYERAMGRALRVYYEGLGRQWLHERWGRRSQKFWDFHRRGLESVGLEIDAKRLVAGAAAAGVRSALSPFDAIRDFVRSRRPLEDPAAAGGRSG